MSANWREDWKDILIVLIPSIISVSFLIKIIKNIKKEKELPTNVGKLIDIFLNSISNEGELISILKENLNDKQIKNLKKYPENRDHNTKENKIIKKLANNLYDKREQNKHEYKKILSKIGMLPKYIFDATTYEIAYITANSNNGFVKFNKKYDLGVLIIAEKKFIEEIELNVNSPTEISNVIVNFWKCIVTILKNEKYEIKNRFLINVNIYINSKMIIEVFNKLPSNKNLDFYVFKNDFENFLADISNYRENYDLEKSRLGILKKVALTFILNDLIKYGDKIYLLQCIRNKYLYESKLDKFQAKNDANHVRNLTYDILNELALIL